jgi:hypothetical protein
MLADGSEHASEIYVLHEVQVGDHIVRNVVASVVPVKWRRFARSKLSLEIARLAHRKHPAGACDCRRGRRDAKHACRAYNHPCLAGVKPIRCNRLGRGYRQTRLEFESGHTSTRCRGGTRRVWCCGLQVIVSTGPAMGSALAATENGKYIGAASRADRIDARLAALANCQKGNAGECAIQLTTCNQ